MSDKLLGNRYEVIEQIGQGGMAKVYRATDTLLNRNVAIKILKDEYTEDKDFINKFRRESQAAASLSNINIVNTYDVGMDTIEDKTVYYIVMEYVEGKTLKDIINEKGKLSIEETLNYSLQIANGLKVAHENNIIHRDIKPQNMMVDKEGNIKVMDFGIARATTSSTITTTSQELGSVHYFSPEQARGGYTDEKSDIYSLGIVIYEMITGKLPFTGESPITIALKQVQEEIIPPRKLDDSIPVELENIILKAVNKSQIERYQSIYDMIIELNNIAREYGLSPVNNIQEKVIDTSSHTRVIDPTEVNSYIKNEQPIEKEPKKVKKEKKSKKESNKMPIILGALFAFLIVAGLFFGRGLIAGLFSSEEVEMPELVGLTEEEAIEEIERAGLRIADIIEGESDEYDLGIVIRQDPKSGTKLKKNYPVKITVSGSEKAIRVPNLIGMDIEEALQLLDAKGIKFSNIDRRVNEAEEGEVIKQSIEPGKKINKNERIDLVVSLGEDNDLVTMESLIGLTLREARIKLDGMKLNIGKVNEDYSSQEEGTVISQSVNTGEEIEEGSKIDITISLGKKADETVDVEVNNTNTNNKRPAQIRNYEYTINAGDGSHIKVIKTENGVDQVVYDQYLSGENNITVSGSEGAVFSIYKDGVKVQ